MTAPYRRTDSVDVLGNHERRIGVLEAIALPALPYAWIRRETNANVLSSGSFDTRLTLGNTFDAGDSSDAAYFTVDLVNGRININATGIYHAMLDVWWTGTDMTQVTTLHLNTGNTLETGSGTRHSGGSNIAGNAFQSWKNPVASMLTMIDALVSDNFFSMTATNYNASTRTIDAIYMNVVRVSAI